jgi:hypothetical protein
VVTLIRGGRDCLLFDDSLNEARYARGGNRLGVLDVWEDDEAPEI